VNRGGCGEQSSGEQWARRPTERIGIIGFLDKVKGLASQNADKVNEAIERVGDVVDEKTEGKFKGVVDQAQEAAKKAVEGNHE
jgi:hypothetical protein